MTLSLYTAIVPSYLQILQSVKGLIDKAEAYCTENQLEPATLIQARLAEDMLPLAFQIRSVAVHSKLALDGVLSGLCRFEPAPPPEDFASLRALVVEAIDSLKALDPAALDARLGQDVRFEFGPRVMNFTAEDFLFSFSQPNFYFHASTAYGILRMKGLKIGKGDFLGAIRAKR